MPFRQTIAAKIFGLAIILLLLTIGLAGFLLYEVTRTTEDLTVVANFDVPLTQSLARLDEFGLRRRLAFERWFGALNAAEPNREIVAEATENYTLFHSQADRRIFNVTQESVTFVPNACLTQTPYNFRRLCLRLIFRCGRNGFVSPIRL